MHGLDTGMLWSGVEPPLEALLVALNLVVWIVGAYEITIVV